MQPTRVFRDAALSRGECVIRPVGELTETTAPALRTSITRTVLEGSRRIVLDLSLTSRIDGPGREALVRCSRAVHAAHATLVLTAAPSDVRDLVQAAGAETDAQERIDGTDPVGDCA